MKFPDYDRSSLSITASISGYFGGKSSYPLLPEIEAELEKGGINKIVLVVPDGMGENLLRRQLDRDSFLLSHDVCAVSAVYPSTTTAATTSLWTGVSPLEHGWLGWSLYFKECARQIDAFIGTDGHTGERFPGGTPAPVLMALPPLLLGQTGAETHMIFPFPTHQAGGSDRAHVVKDLDDQLSCALNLCRGEGKKLICVYNGDPDHTMHVHGVNSPEAAAAFRQTDKSIASFCEKLPKDTLAVITADHGLVDSTVPVKLNEIPSIDECLWMPPSIEFRASAFFVKPWKAEQFVREFNRVCGEDFILLSREEALKRNLFGRGVPHKKSEDFMGDFIACAAGERYLRYDTISGREPRLIGQHAGLTVDEMTVPVILIRGGN